MFDHGLTHEQLRATLGAARAVACADGRLEDHERALIEAAARALGWQGGIDDIEPSSPEQVAQLITDDTTRTRLVQALLLVAIMDGEVTDVELGVLRSYARALGVDEPRLDNLRQIAHGHSRLAYVDLWRKSSMLRTMADTAWKKRGLRGLWLMVGGMKGHATDPDLAWRYKRLGLLPEGTFGREYWVHMTERNFALPGEPNGFAEEMVKHDLAHVLSGYDTDPTGECEVVAFISGFMKTDPFSYLFQVFIHMQLGVHVFDGTPTEHMVVPADRVVAALERGSRVKADLYDPSWDIWAEFPRPIDQVRASYGIAPLG